MCQMQSICSLLVAGDAQDSLPWHGVPPLEQDTAIPLARIAFVISQSWRMILALQKSMQPTLTHAHTHQRAINSIDARHSNPSTPNRTLRIFSTSNARFGISRNSMKAAPSSRAASSSSSWILRSASEIWKSTWYPSYMIKSQIRKVVYTRTGASKRQDCSTKAWKPASQPSYLCGSDTDKEAQEPLGSDGTHCHTIVVKGLGQSGQAFLYQGLEDILIHVTVPRTNAQ